VLSPLASAAYTTAAPDPRQQRSTKAEAGLKDFVGVVFLSLCDRDDLTPFARPWAQELEAALQFLRFHEDQPPALCFDEAKDAHRAEVSCLEIVAHECPRHRWPTYKLDSSCPEAAARSQLPASSCCDCGIIQLWTSRCSCDRWPGSVKRRAKSKHLRPDGRRPGKSPHSRRSGRSCDSHPPSSNDLLRHPVPV
jgi:hypothetical protein